MTALLQRVQILPLHPTIRVEYSRCSAKHGVVVSHQDKEGEGPPDVAALPKEVQDNLLRYLNRNKVSDPTSVAEDPSAASLEPQHQQQHGRPRTGTRGGSQPQKFYPHQIFSVNNVNYVVVDCFPKSGYLSSDTIIFTQDYYVTIMRHVEVVLLLDASPTAAPLPLTHIGTTYRGGRCLGTLAVSPSVPQPVVICASDTSADHRRDGRVTPPAPPSNSSGGGDEPCRTKFPPTARRHTVNEWDTTTTTAAAAAAAGADSTQQQQQEERPAAACIASSDSLSDPTTDLPLPPNEAAAAETGRHRASMYNHEMPPTTAAAADPDATQGGLSSSAAAIVDPLAEYREMQRRRFYQNHHTAAAAAAVDGREGDSAGGWPLSSSAVLSSTFAIHDATRMGTTTTVPAATTTRRDGHTPPQAAASVAPQQQREKNDAVLLPSGGGGGRCCSAVEGGDPSGGGGGGFATVDDNGSTDSVVERTTNEYDDDGGGLPRRCHEPDEDSLDVCIIPDVWGDMTLDELNAVFRSDVLKYLRNHTACLLYPGKRFTVSGRHFMIGASVPYGPSLYCPYVTDITFRRDPVGEFNKIHICPIQDTLPRTYDFNVFEDYIRPYFAARPFGLFGEGDTYRFNGVQFKVLRTEPCADTLTFRITRFADDDPPPPVVAAGTNRDATASTDDATREGPLQSSTHTNREPLAVGRILRNRRGSAIGAPLVLRMRVGLRTEIHCTGAVTPTLQDVIGRDATVRLRMTPARYLHYQIQMVLIGLFPDEYERVTNMQTSDMLALRMKQDVERKQAVKKLILDQRSVTMKTLKFSRGGRGEPGTTGVCDKSVEEEEAPVCVVCLSEFDEEVSSAENPLQQRTEQAVLELPCSHIFHVTCVDFWLDRSTCCPLCKRDIVSFIDFSEVPSAVREVIMRTAVSDDEDFEEAPTAVEPSTGQQDRSDNSSSGRQGDDDTPPGGIWQRIVRAGQNFLFT